MPEPYEVKRLTPAGIARFREWLENGARGAAPVELLFGDTSERLEAMASVQARSFRSRLELGVYLAEALREIPISQLRFDAGVWDWLSLLYMDILAPRAPDGSRSIKQIYRYTLELKNRLWSRHILRMSWMAVIEHGEACRVMLAAPISKQTETLEQLAGQQEVFGAKTVVQAADRLYWDTAAGALKRGAQGKGAGTPRRLVKFMRQFRRTYDPPTMTVDQVFASLPDEFDKWRTVEAATLVSRSSPEPISASETAA